LKISQLRSQKFTLFHDESGERLYFSEKIWNWPRGSSHEREVRLLGASQVQPAMESNWSRVTSGLPTICHERTR